MKKDLLRIINNRHASVLFLVIFLVASFNENNSFIVAFYYFVVFFFVYRIVKTVEIETTEKLEEEVEDMKRNFIAMAAHELRSPLATVRGYVELIRDQKNLNEKQVEYARRTEAAAENLHDLVVDMIETTRLEQGLMSFQYTDFDIGEMVGNVLKMFEREAEKKNLKLKRKDYTEIVMHFDEEKMHRVLVNLVSNAIKYTNKGSVTISYKTKGNRLVLKVSDTGIGISKEDQKKLFHKFYRIRSAETESVQGTGLGLWLSREIIRKQKGDVTVQSTRGKGTELIVHLPI